VTETTIAISRMTSGLFRLPNRVRCLTQQGWIVLLTLWGISNGNLFAQAPILEVRQPVQQFLKTTCFGCHGEEKQKGKVRLDTLAPTLGDPASAQLWQDVLDVINKGDMPPPEEKYDQAALAEAVGLLTEDLLKARKLLSDRGGEVVTRRLTELEYINTLRVLTGVTVPESLAPDDESGTDFNTLGRYQTFSPSMLEQYEEAARYAIGQLLTVPTNRERQVIREDGTKNMRQQKQREWDKHNEQCQRALTVPKGTTDYTKFGFKNDAEYTTALRDAPDFYLPLLKHYLDNPNTESGVVLYQASMGPLTTGLSTKAEPGAEYIFRARVAAEPGMTAESKVLELGIFQNREKKTLEYLHITGSMEAPQIIEKVVRPEPGEFGLQLGFSDLFDTRKKNTTAVQKGKSIPGYWIDWVEVEGPFFPEERDRRREELLMGKAVTDEAAPQMIEAFTRRAFRGKPAEASFSKQLGVVYRSERESGKSPGEAIVAPLAMILSSPPFLYLGEDKSDAERKTITGMEMATRLSYLLWKEPASAEMLQAGNRLLSDPAYLHRAVDSMIGDPRFDRFVREFFGQWLHLRKYDGLIFDKVKVAEFGRDRKHFAKEQLYHFCAHLIRQDLSLANLIDSDFTLLNGTMATLYGDVETGPLSDDFVRVSLSEKNRHRGGLLGMTVIQAMGSTGEHTAPVERGAFVLRKFLNSPPPPPPPNVPQLAHEDESLSIREKLRIHKEIPQCISCHRKMDDMGLAMEHLDVIGLWRERDNGKPIETAGKMHDGTPFADFSEMKRHLLGHREAMIHSVVEGLIAYALGREAEFSDQEFIDSVVRETRGADYRFRALLKAFVRHQTFTSK
jgi:hypothetical protein